MSALYKIMRLSFDRYFLILYNKPILNNRFCDMIHLMVPWKSCIKMQAKIFKRIYPLTIMQPMKHACACMFCACACMCMHVNQFSMHAHACSPIQHACTCMFIYSACMSFDMHACCLNCMHVIWYACMSFDTHAYVTPLCACMHQICMHAKKLPINGIMYFPNCT